MATLTGDLRPQSYKDHAPRPPCRAPRGGLNAFNSTEIFSEELRIAPLKPVERGKRVGGALEPDQDLQATINHFVAETKLDLKSFTWTADLDNIIAALRQGHEALGSIY